MHDILVGPFNKVVVSINGLFILDLNAKASSCSLDFIIDIFIDNGHASSLIRINVV